MPQETLRHRIQDQKHASGHKPRINPLDSVFMAFYSPQNVQYPTRAHRLLDTESLIPETERQAKAILRFVDTSGSVW